MSALGLEENIKRALDAIGPTESNAPRRLVAVAGPPASGKSTLATVLRDRMRARGTPCGLLTMDGFHLDNPLLTSRRTLERKGAPETFDLAGFKTTIERLMREDHVYVPIFDRALDRSIAAAAEITGRDRIVIVEGNYLLLDEPLWRDLRSHWQFSVFLSGSIDILQERLVARWIAHDHDPAEALRRALANDIPNARRVLDRRLPCDLELSSDR